MPEMFPITIALLALAAALGAVVRRNAVERYRQKLLAPAKSHEYDLREPDWQWPDRNAALARITADYTWHLTALRGRAVLRRLS